MKCLFVRDLSPIRFRIEPDVGRMFFVDSGPQGDIRAATALIPT